MSRIHGNPIVRSLALATLTLAGATACRTDGPVAPQTLAGSRRPDAPQAIKLKPQLYFNGIIFEGTQDHALGELYSMNPDGTGLFRLTTDTLSDRDPDVSPNGPAFIWSRYSPGNKLAELYTQNLDGTKRKQLTALGALTQFPRYSPDGTKIAFVASVPIYGQEIFTVNADGSGLHRLTYATSDENSPSWSPDGQTIVFASTRLGPASIYTMGADGLNVQLLRECIEGCLDPALNPAGTLVAFDDAGEGSIGVISLAGQGDASVGPVFAQGESRHPTWTKSGTQVLFASSRGIEGTFEIYAGTPDNADPSSVHRLTVFSPGDAQTPAYSK